MYRIKKVKVLPAYRLRIKFFDGTEGIVDLSDLVGQGIFSKWSDKEYFNSVYVDPENHTVAWPGGIDLCPYTLYAEIKGKSIETLLTTNVSMKVS